MLKIFFLIAVALASQIPRANAAPKKSTEEVFATCSNKEAVYEFHGDAAGRITYVLVRQKPYPEQRLECSAGTGKGEQAVCDEVDEANELVFYTAGYAVMHYNTDNDSNSDGPKASCK